jgi:hypothetical protein
MLVNHMPKVPRVSKSYYYSALDHTSPIAPVSVPQAMIAVEGETNHRKRKSRDAALHLIKKLAHQTHKLTKTGRITCIIENKYRKWLYYLLFASSLKFSTAIALIVLLQ